MERKNITKVVDSNISQIVEQATCTGTLKNYYSFHGKIMKKCIDLITKEDTTEEVKTKALCQIELSRMIRKFINIALKRELTQEEIESFRQQGYGLYHKYYERF